jgi:hypothetical protein
MGEVIIIFSLAAAGCLIRLSTDLVLQLLARRAAAGTIAAGPDRGQSHDAAQPKTDPLAGVALTLTCYGALAVVVVSEYPGQLALQRTWLAFALMCVGGLIGEISRTGTGRAAQPDLDAEEDEAAERTPGSVGLSVALMLTLNLAIAVLVSGQGLVPIVPPPASAVDTQSTELEQIVVVARRGADDSGSSSFL